MVREDATSGIFIVRCAAVLCFLPTPAAWRPCPTTTGAPRTTSTMRTYVSPRAAAHRNHCFSATRAVVPVFDVHETSSSPAADHETVRISNQNIRNALAFLYYHTKKTARGPITYCQNLVFSVARGNQRQPAMKPFVSKPERSCFEACFEMWDMQRQVPQFDAGAGQLVE